MSNYRITPENYSRYTIKPIIDALDRGYIKRIAYKSNTSDETVRNFAYGKQFNPAVLEVVMGEYIDKLKHYAQQFHTLNSTI